MAQVALAFMASKYSTAFAHLLWLFWVYFVPISRFPSVFIYRRRRRRRRRCFPVSQVHYLKATNELPWNIKDWMANVYLGLIIVLTLMSQIFGLAIALGRPIIDPKNNPAHRVFFETVSDIYVPLVFFVPLLFAKPNLQNGDVHTITYD
jgi:hypothetical protein